MHPDSECNSVESERLVREMSKAESLFTAEAHLRAKAVELANWTKKPGRKTINEVRHELRVAALEYARIANEIDGAP